MASVSNPIPRVKCTVNKCRYWVPGNICRAKSIEIRGEDATTVESTACGTFEFKR